MIAPGELEELVEEALQGIDLIKSKAVLITESQLSARIKDKTPEELPFLVGMLPSANRQGSKDHNDWNNILMFFILTKTDYGRRPEDQEFTDYQSLFEATMAFLDFLDDKSSEDCDLLKNWNGKVAVDPEYNFAGCDGWSITLNLSSDGR